MLAKGNTRENNGDWVEAYKWHLKLYIYFYTTTYFVPCGQTPVHGMRTMHAKFITAARF